MKFKNILFFSFLLLSAFEGFAQNVKDSANELSGLSFKDRLTFNIGGGLMFGNTYTNVNLQPQIGYRITPRFTSGIGGNFQYYRNTFLSPDPFLIYGGNVFSRYMVSDNLFAQAEYQLLQFRESWGEYALLGGGYMPSRGVFVSAYYLLMYPRSNNLYGAPYVIRIGFIL